MAHFRNSRRTLFVVLAAPVVLLVLAAAVVLPVNVIGPQESRTLVPSVPSHYWRLDESIGNQFADQHGGLPARCTDCPRPIPGIVGRAQSFADVTTGLRVAPSDNLDWPANQNFSIETWVRVASCDDAQAFVGRVGTDTAARWSLGCEAGVAVFEFDGGNDGENRVLRGSRGIADDRWHHVAAVRDALTGQLRLYVDGREDGRLDTAASQPVRFSGSALTIGFLQQPGDERPFTGALDELAVRGRALSATQIDRHFNDGATGLALGYDTCPTLPVRIMPLGDSNTRRRGYRNWLSQAMREEGYEKSFVGGRRDKCDEPCDYSYHHSGTSGWRPSDIAAILPHWLRRHKPEVILLHIGTNELDVPGVDEILDIIQRHDPGTVVLLARIINRKEYHAETTAFNDEVEALANTRIARGQRIRVVDQEAALNYPEDMSDELHPNKSGFEKMGATWLRDLRRFLPACSPVPPNLVSASELKAEASVAFESDLVTASIPSPVYTLVEGPTGLRLHPDTGRILWPTPVAGIHPIRIMITNPSGRTTQSIMLHVTGVE